ncbi:MAG TPA: DUF1573 domain-containing protein [Candidatus Acidoferrales bacterium]|nr:DUF1573 domain-containing protein [Candidatus Acidoferrales bacterium]
MKHKFIFRMLPILVLLFAAAGAKAQLKVLEGNEISFGKIYQTGEKVHEAITLKNLGNEAIKITNVGTSCGCTAAMISDSTLEPGGQVRINIEFNPLGYIGEVSKNIYVYTSDPKTQLISIRMTGYVAYALQSTPNNAVFGEIKVGTTDSTSVTLSNTSDEQIQITKVEIPYDEITYRLDKKELKPGEFTDLHLYLSPKDQNNISGFIKIFSTSTLQPVLQVRIFAGTLLR